jgi:hypothetical protein
VEAVNAHEDQHAKDEHTLSGFGKLWTKEGQRELEVNAFKAELSVEERDINALESKGSARTSTDEKSLIILRNMRDQANGVIQNPQVHSIGECDESPSISKSGCSDRASFSTWRSPVCGPAVRTSDFSDH